MGLVESTEALLAKLNTVENRNKGHTLAGVAHAKNIDAIFIAANHSESARIGIKHVSYRDPKSFLGIKQPIVVDHHVWESITKDLLILIEGLKEEKNKANQVLQMIHQLSDRSV